MKYILITAAFMLSLAVQAQMKEGKIIYERVSQMPTRILSSMDAEIAEKLPKSRTDHYELLFGNNQSLYQYLPTAVAEEQGVVTGNGFVMRFAGGTNEVSYYNFEAGTRIDQREIMDNTYLVTDSISKGTWKLTDETKKIDRFTVRKAIGQRISTRTQMSMENGEMKKEEIADTVAVTAWFTTDIPVPVGPQVPGQLPGAILELDYNNGQTVYKAIEISEKVNTSKIKAPGKGKKISPAEFDREREKMIEEMRKNNPGQRIRISG